MELNPRDYRAWYGMGQTYELLQMPFFALHYYRRATQLRPQDARMWCAPLYEHVMFFKCCWTLCIRAAVQPAWDPAACPPPACIVCTWSQFSGALTLHVYVALHQRLYPGVTTLSWQG